MQNYDLLTLHLKVTFKLYSWAATLQVGQLSWISDSDACTRIADFLVCYVLWLQLRVPIQTRFCMLVCLIDAMLCVMIAVFGDLAVVCLCTIILLHTCMILGTDYRTYIQGYTYTIQTSSYKSVNLIFTGMPGRRMFFSVVGSLNSGASSDSRINLRHTCSVL